MGKQVQNIIVGEQPECHEKQHVHDVYDQIASHFSSTRYKPWPIIAAFMDSIADGSLGIDAGTGNGKYLPLHLDRHGSVRTIGLDRSRNLLAFARCAGIQAPGIVMHDVVLGDVVDQPWRPGVFDYAISIATIHHLASHERRRYAVQRLLEGVSPDHGRVLIYVWAIEQDELSKRTVHSDDQLSENHQQSSVMPHGQDVFVPWVLPNASSTAVNQANVPNAPQVFNRYYHMFAQGELLVLVEEAVRVLGLVLGDASGSIIGTSGVEVVRHGWERSNHYVELRRWKR